MRIFISSTYRDLKDDRWSLLIGLKKAGFDSLGMEFFAAEPDTPKQVSLREVRSSNLVILLVGNRYGSLDPETGKSYTHLEYEEAKNSNIHVLAFFKDLPEEVLSLDKNLQDFRAQIEEQPNYFQDPLSLRDCVWAGFIKYLRDRGEITRGVPVFQTFVDFFQLFLDDTRLFNHSHRLVGREHELGRLIDFIRNPPQRIVILTGAGGVGESKLLVESLKTYSQEPLDWDMRFLSAYSEFAPEALAELPAANVCVVIEDAHKREDLGPIVDALLHPKYRGKTKLIISMRPSGLQRAKQVLASHDPKEEAWIHVQPLDRQTHAVQLAKDALGPDYVLYADQLVRASDCNSLIITMGGALIRDARIEAGLVENENFRDKVLEKLLEDAEADLSITPNLDVRRVLATLAGIGPVEITAEKAKEALSKAFAVAWTQLSQLIDELENRGLVLRRGRKVRVCPDVLADYVLLSRSFNNHREPTGFVDDLFKEYSNLYFSNILRNVAEIEFSIELKGKEASLLDNVWSDIWRIIESADYQQLSALLDHIESVAYFKPDKALEIAKWLLEPSNLVRSQREGPWKDVLDHVGVLRKIPAVLKRIAWNRNYTTEVCEILWDLANGPLADINPNPFPEHPFRILKELASLDNHNYFSIVNNCLDGVEKIVEAGKHRKTHFDIQEILEATLKQEIQYISSDRRTFTISFARAYSFEPKIRARIEQVRDRAISLLAKLATDEDPKVVSKTAHSLMQMLHIHHRGDIDKISDQEKEDLTREADKALAILESILAANINVTMTNHILDELGSPQAYFMESVEHKVRDVVEKYKQENLMYRVQYCMCHDWPEFDRQADDDYETREKRFLEYERKVAGELWAACDGEPSKLVAYIKGITDSLSTAGIGCEARAFQRICAEQGKDKAANIIRELLAIDDTYMAFSITYWFPYVPTQFKYAVASEILEHGKTQHKRGLASAVRSLADMGLEDACATVTRLVNDPDENVKSCIVHGLGWLYRECGQPEQIKRLVCDIDVGDDAQLLNALLRAIDKRHGINPDSLSKDEIARLVNKIEKISRLDRNHYEVGQFLSFCLTTDPKAVIRMLLKRVSRSITADGKHDRRKEFQPFPYTGFGQCIHLNVLDHSDFSECVRLIVHAVAKDQWEYRFWCPRIFNWLDPNFAEKSRNVLKDILKDATEGQTIGIACLLEDYEHGIIFVAVDFLGDLLTRAADIGEACYRKASSKLAGAVFSGSWAESPPGEPSAHWVGIAESCEAVLKRQDLPKPVCDFYRSVKEHAENLNLQKLERDKMEEQEEDI